MGIRDVLEKFANGTTLHGVPKVINARSTLARVFWSVVCLSAGGMFCMQMSEVLHRYFSYPKKVTVEVVPSPVPFPAISMCNMRNLDVFILNILNRKFIENSDPLSHVNTSDHLFIREYMKITAKYGPLWYTYQTQYPLQFQEIFSRTTYSANIPEEIITEAAVQIDQFIVNCFFGEFNCNVTRDFTTFFDPYYFNCFTYNAPKVGDASVSEGIENGWSTIMFSGSGMLDKNKDIRVLPGLHESRSAVAANEGVRVVIHPPGTIPFPFTEGFDVPPGFSASFGIRPRRLKRIGRPHGNCTDTNPFGEDAAKYRVMSCQKMCLQRFIITSCGCKDASLPDVPGDEADPCRLADDLPDLCMTEASPICLERFFDLYERIQCIRTTKDSFTRRPELLAECKCYPPCDEIMYDVSYSLSKWPASGYEGDAAYFDVFYIEGFRERFFGTPNYNIVTAYFTDDTREKTMKDFARLNVYIADSNAIITQEMEDYSSTQLVSDIGGQLGLWVGISVITLAEVLELICDLFRLICSARKRSSRGRDLNRERVKKGHTSPPNNWSLPPLDRNELQTMIIRPHNGKSSHR